MTDAADLDTAEEETSRKASKLPLILGLVLAIFGGAGGFFAVQAGLIGGAGDAGAGEPEEAIADAARPERPEVSFVALEPLVISLPRAAARTHLRFSAQLEVAPEHADEVEAITPRIIDVLNSYLRVVDLADLEDPTALMRLRAQMLRRVQVVAGPGRVRDVLIMEFVLN